MAEARIDKWMWAVRIFKTRTIAAEACKMNRVTINGAYVKASRMIKPGDVVQVKKPPITYSFKVLQAIEKRVGAKLVSLRRRTKCDRDDENENSGRRHKACTRCNGKRYHSRPIRTIGNE